MERTLTPLYTHFPNLVAYYGRQNTLQDLSVVIAHDHVPTTETRGESSLLILLITDLALSLNRSSSVACLYEVPGSDSGGCKDWKGYS
jgi:hypothetical protein